MRRAEIQHLAMALAGTRRKNRAMDLVTLAGSLVALKGEYGSIQAVARAVGISSEMVREFLHISDLSGPVKKAVRQRKIDSVDVAYRLSRLPRPVQDALAREIVARHMTSDDVRWIDRYLRDHPGVSVRDAVDRVLRSKDRIEYVAYLRLSPRIKKNLRRARMSDTAGLRVAQAALERAIAKADLLSLERLDDILKVRVTAAGLRSLRVEARRMGVPLREVAGALALETLSGHKQLR